MKKSFFSVAAIAMALTIWTGASISAQASDNTTVTFTNSRALEYGNASGSGEEVNLGDAFANVVPGEERNQTITLKNEYNNSVDFYMSAEVLKALEETGKGAAGAGYDIVLTAGGQILYDSSVGGYKQSNGAASVDGLKEMNNSALKDSVLIATLAKDQTADVVLKIIFDGEAMDNNAAAVNYADTVGQIRFAFQAGYEDPTGLTTVYKVVTSEGETKYITRIVEERVPLAVPTGDSAMLALGALVLIAGIALLFLTRKKKGGKANVSALLFGTALCFLLSGADAKAASEKTYTVTYRPGNVGAFAVEKEESAEAQEGEENDKCKAALEVANMLYGADESVRNIEVTKNGAIKLTVVEGAAIPQAPSYVKVQEGYFVKNASEWGPDANALVEKNIDFVVDYGKLIDGVEYTVRYVDIQDGSSIAPVSVAYANAGDKVEIKAPATITISGAAVYLLRDEAVQTLVLSKDEKAVNEIVFRYEAAPRGTNVVTTTEYTEGQTVENTEVVTVTVPVRTPGANLAPNQTPVNQNPVNQEDVTVIPEDNTPADVAPESDTAAEDAEVTEQSDQPGETVDIQDEQTALSSGVKVNAPLLWIFAGTAILLAAVSVIWAMARKRAEDRDRTEE